MAERRKIIIPVITDPNEPLPVPHFDAEATQTAQRVVPLSDEEARLLHQGNYGMRAQKPFWKRPAIIAVVILIAAGIGVAAGFAIGMYKNRKATQTPVVNAQPSPTDSANQIAEQPAPTPTPQARASVPEKPSETPSAAPAEPKTEERSPATRNETKNRDDETAPPAASDKKRNGKDENENAAAVDEKQAERERRREARRTERRREQDEENPVDVPRPIDRARRQIDRIRDIFEGRQP